MTVEVMSHVWKTARQKGSALLMLLAIADFANEDGYAYPAIETLAEKTRTTVRSAQRMLDSLEADGALTIFNRVDPENEERHFSNVYKLPMPGKENAEPPPIFGKVKARTITLPNDTSVTTVMTPASLPNDTSVTTVMTPASPDPLVDPLAYPSIEPTPQPPASKPRNEIFDAVSWAWQNNNGGYVGKLIKFTTGKCEKQDGLYFRFQIDPAMTACEIIGFRLWRDNLERDMPTVPETIQRLVEEFRGVLEYTRILENADRVLDTLSAPPGKPVAQSPPESPSEPIIVRSTDAIFDVLDQKLGGQIHA